MLIEDRLLKLDCSNYKDIYHAPIFFADRDKFDMVVFDMKKIMVFQSDELTHFRCLFDMARDIGITARVLHSKNESAVRYAEGMGLFKGFDVPGIPFKNHRQATYIPLTRIDSDYNEFLFEEFQKIFEHMHLSASVIPDLCLAFTEIADNIFYHSGIQDNTGWGYIAAQVYKNRVQISFTDCGTGFEAAYERSQTKRNRTNLELLKDSLNYLESRFNIPGQKATRGIGLHEARKLATDSGGRMVLRSGDGMVSLLGKSPMVAMKTTWLFCGTQVSMEIPI